MIDYLIIIICFLLVIGGVLKYIHELKSNKSCSGGCNMCPHGRKCKNMNSQKGESQNDKFNRVS